MLAEYYLKRYSEKYHAPTKEVTLKTLEIFQNYSWPGNVRELKNLIEKLVVLSKSEMIDIEDLPQHFYSPGCNIPFEKRTDTAMQELPAASPPSSLSLKVMEEEFIVKALRLADGNQRKAARFLNISRDTLRYRLKKLRIDSSKYNQ